MAEFQFEVLTSEDSSRFEVWSDARPVFEPKGRLLELRSAIRGGVKALAASESEVLEASYISNEASRCDVENIVLYNIGPSNFVSAGRNGMRIERGYGASPERAGRIWPHYLSYFIRSKEPTSLWRASTELAGWTRCPIPGLSSSTKVSGIWAKLKAGLPPAAAFLSTPYFGLDLRVHRPDVGGANALPGFIKPLLDGVICAFHKHDGSDVLELSQRISHEAGLVAEEAQRLLLTDERAALGQLQLLHRFQRGVQWNPADDRCVSATVVVSDEVGLDAWGLSGRIFEVDSIN